MEGETEGVICGKKGRFSKKGDGKGGKKPANDVLYLGQAKN